MKSFSPSLTHLTDTTLLEATRQVSIREKQCTLQLLEHLLEIDRRKAYAERAYSSLFDYVVRELRYSESQAAERVNAARLLRSTPETRESLASGELTLTTAAQIQRHLQAEMKSGNELSEEKKTDLIEECLGQSKRTVEKVLLREASPQVRKQMEERVTQKTPERTELKFTVDESVRLKIDQAKELLGELTLEALLDQALQSLINQESRKRGRTPKRVTSSNVPTTDSTATSTPPVTQPKASTSRFIPIDFKRAVSARSGDQCEFVDTETGRRCPSRFRLQIDHRHPLALGGLTTPDNLRHLCANHNAHAARTAGLGHARR